VNIVVEVLCLMFDVWKERVKEGKGGNGSLDLNVRRSN
jgi:hypothetical protein